MDMRLCDADPCSDGIDPSVLEEQQSRARCKLPVEILVIVTEFLLGDLCYGTAANLNATCRVVHAETCSALYAVVFWPYPYFEAVALESSQSPTSPWRYIRYLVIQDIPRSSFILGKKTHVPHWVNGFQYPSLFTSVKMVVWKSKEIYRDLVSRRTPTAPSSTRDLMTACHIFVYQEVKYDMMPVVIHPNIPSTTAGSGSLTVGEIQDYSNEEQVSEVIFRKQGRLVSGVDNSSREQERHKLTQSLTIRHLTVEVDEFATTSLEVDFIRDVLRMGEDPLYGPRWNLCILGKSTLLKNFMIAASTVNNRVLLSLNVYGFRSQLAYYVNPAKWRGHEHTFLLRDPKPPIQLRPIMKEAVQGYLLARRHFYNQLDDTTQHQRLNFMWECHQAFDWTTSATSMGARLADLYNNRIRGLAVIVAGPSNCHQVILGNADTRPSGQRPAVNLFLMSKNWVTNEMVVEDDSEWFEKMYREE